VPCLATATALALFGLSLAPTPAGAACVLPPGDVTGDGSTSVVDVQCEIVSALWILGGGVLSPPDCVGPGFNFHTDHNCDASLDVSDVQLVIVFALGSPVSPALDSNANACVDACEPLLVDCAVAPLMTPCDDGDPCTLGDACVLGACKPDSVDACDDGKPCSIDACEPGLGCVYAEVVCDDGNPCTADACADEKGGCTHTATESPACPSGKPCAEYEECASKIPAMSDACSGDLSQCAGLAAYVTGCKALHASCVHSNKVLPAGWTCPAGLYGAGDGCDCGCGALDSDCAVTPDVVFGCAVGHTCDASGACVLTDPSEPDCTALNACADVLAAVATCQAQGLPSCEEGFGKEAEDCTALLAACEL
jgi:hypothetical protein